MKQDSFVLENYLTENNRFLLDAWPTRMKNDLDIVCFDNATILPWKSSKNSWGLGGVEDASEKFIDQSAYMNGWSKYGGEYKINEAPAEVDEYFVWMGIFVRQWGHFLLDCVNRLWCINDNMYKDLKVAYICDPSTEISGNYLRFLELLGVKKEHFRSHGLYFRRGIALTPSSLRDNPVLFMNFVLFALPVDDADIPYISGLLADVSPSFCISQEKVNQLRAKEPLVETFFQAFGYILEHEKQPMYTINETQLLSTSNPHMDEMDVIKAMLLLKDASLSPKRIAYEDVEAYAAFSKNFLQKAKRREK